MTPKEYWQECIAQAAEECDLPITPEQLASLAEAVKDGHECYGMAFYSPPPSDRFAQIERDHKAEVARMAAEAERYRSITETVVGRILRQHSGASISITDDGEVLRHDGRTERIA